MAALPHNYEVGQYAKDTYFLFDDFNYFVTADLWTSVLTDSGTASVSDGARGTLALVCSDGSVADNDEAYVRTTTELFLVADNKPLRFEARMQYTEANTDDANVFCGFMSAIAANALVDDGAGMRTTGNYFVFFKVDGGTTWQVRSRNGSTTYTNDTGITAGGATYQKFRVEIDNEGDGGTNVQVKYFIDDVQCKDATTFLPIVHKIPISSSTEMHAGAGAKNGGANLETLNIDYIYASQKR
ncbi:MAG TPA: hypothetical protein VEA69_13335 [Tepidisphaeraceae bacterium]|nr:hypothetical protein [Tepidisphaeraceae bacterium]